ncbi:MAG: hypothetical protein J6K25_08010 [Thermoguttaceae bacterium]|nr:hypothetical protein [Thermoguttaceae bacterium]
MRSQDKEYAAVVRDLRKVVRLLDELETPLVRNALDNVVSSDVSNSAAKRWSGELGDGNDAIRVAIRRLWQDVFDLWGDDSAAATTEERKQNGNDVQ